MIFGSWGRLVDPPAAFHWRLEAILEVLKAPPGALGPFLSRPGGPVGHSGGGGRWPRHAWCLGEEPCPPALLYSRPA
eukprot:6812475-Pyramimonas_sp.AAC.2